MSWCLDSISSTACRVIWESEIIWVKRSTLSEEIFLHPPGNAVLIPPLDGSNQLCRTAEEKGFGTLHMFTCICICTYVHIICTYYNM